MAAHGGAADSPNAPAGRPAGRRIGRPALVDASLAAVLFIVAALVFLRAVETVPFHGDESEWINNGRYFRYVFLDHDVTSNVWRPSWVNRDQPPGGRYIIGAIVWASGADPARVNRTYTWDRDYETNLRDGRVPGPEILLPVRRTMAVIGAICVVLLFVAGRIVGGSVTGFVAGGFVIASPLLQTYFAQARTEALLALFSVMGLVLLLLFARRFQRSGGLTAAGWTVGPVMGVALATKLTAAVAILGVCAYAGVAGLARLAASRTEAVRMIGWSLATGMLATAVWVIVNPFLWPDPIVRTWSMLEQQQSIMVEQGAKFGNPVDLPLPSRVLLMVRRTFVATSTPPFDDNRPPGSEPRISNTFTPTPAVLGVSVELGLAALGLAALVWRVTAVVRAGERHGPELALLWWLAAYLLGIGANLSLDWPRYYVPTAFFGALLIGHGAQTLTDLLMRRPLTLAGAPSPAGAQPTTTPTSTPTTAGANSG